MVNKILSRIYSWGFGKRLTVILLLFALVPLLIIQQMMMHFYESHITEAAYSSTLSVVKANNNVLSSMLDGVETTSQLMLDSEFYYDIFSRLNEMSVGDCLRYDRIISTEMAKQFVLLDEVCEAYFYTTKWLFGNNISVMPSSWNQVENAGFVQLARQYSGLPCWITGYDYGQSIGSEYWQNKGSYSFQYPLTMVRQMNFQYSFLGSFEQLSDEQEKPILIVHILEPNVRALYQDSINYEDSLYVVANSSGIVVSSDNDMFPVGSTLEERFLQYSGNSGYVNTQLDGTSYLLCYDALADRELFSMAFVPRSVLLAETVTKTRWLQFWCVLVLIVLSATVAFLLSRTITRPIQALTSASLRVAGGDFSADTPVPKGRDFKLLTESFNHMEREIDRLIHENYEITLREKETQLMALSMQINPHFLYNTLNTINMLAIQNDDEETSDLIVDLSEMLQYTFRNTSEKALLSDEIGWVSNYLDIMTKRYDNAFCTRLDIDEGLMDARVPKLILQPLVENSILHGFRDITEGGVLTITISQDETFLCISVADNGKGMDEDELQTYMRAVTQDGHVGISNVHRRLSLLYGDKYHVQVHSAPGMGARTDIRIPLEMG